MTDNITNADMPAMPLPDNVQRDFMESWFHGTSSPIGSGLTKREQFAMAAMQSLIIVINDFDYPTEPMAKVAIAHADALLAELEILKFK